MYPSIQTYCTALTQGFSTISPERKKLLQQVSDYVIARRKAHKPVSLVYICTHNSRRSHFGQVWAQVAGNYYRIEHVRAFSGGTEATAFNLNAIRALERAGFKVRQATAGPNALFHVSYAEDAAFIECFSKVYDHPANPSEDFMAMMTCGEAEANCPFIAGAGLRISTTYDDPKAFDNTPGQEEAYDERCRQIALETFYIFSLINP